MYGTLPQLGGDTRASTACAMSHHQGLAKKLRRAPRRKVLDFVAAAPYRRCMCSATQQQCMYYEVTGALSWRTEAMATRTTTSTSRGRHRRPWIPHRHIALSGQGKGHQQSLRALPLLPASFPCLSVHIISSPCARDIMTERSAARDAMIESANPRRKEDFWCTFCARCGQPPYAARSVLWRR